MSSPSRSSRSSASLSPSPGRGRGRGFFSAPHREVGFGFGAPQASPQNRGGSPMANIYRLDGNNPPTQISGRGRGAGASAVSPRYSPSSSPARSASTPVSSPGSQPGRSPEPPRGPWELAPDIGLTRDPRYYGNSYQPVRMTARERGRGLGRSYGRVPTSSPSSPTSSSSVPSPRTPPGQMAKRPREGSTPPSGAGPSRGKKR